MTSAATATSKSGSLLFGGKHRRRHVRNETLTIVWNYTSTVLREWWAKANGIITPVAATITNNGSSTTAEEQAQTDIHHKGHRNRFWRILYGTYNTNEEDAEHNDLERRKAAESAVVISGSTTTGTTEQNSVELQDIVPATTLLTTTNDVLVLDP